MKLLMLSAVMVCQVFAFASQGVCQEAKPQPDRPYLMHTEAPRLHFSIPPHRKHRARRVDSIKRRAGSKRTAEYIEHGKRSCPPAKRKC
jgi:hypothetical protein